MTIPYVDIWYDSSMRYLGIDYGSKKVGLALSDEAGTMGFPHAIVANDENLLANVLELIAQEKVGAVVVGDSIRMDGTANPIAREARVFGDALKKAASISVDYEQEFFTTQEAKRSLEGVHPKHVHTSGHVRSRGIEKAVDDSAAALILTSYLSRHHDKH